jgi:hypothetical protein
MIPASARSAVVCSVQEQGRPLGPRQAVGRVPPLARRPVELSVR